MNPIRVFARQAVRVPPFAPMGDGGGTAIPEIDPSHAAALCAGMPQRHYMAARFLYSGDTSARDWIRIELMREAMELSHQRWKRDRLWAKWAEHIKTVHGKAASAVLADIAIMAAAEPSRWGSVDAKRGLLVVSEGTWNRRIRQRYAEVENTLIGWASEALRHVARAQD